MPKRSRHNDEQSQPAANGRHRPTGDSNTYRFFVDPHVIQGTRVEIVDAALVHQLGSVLRLRSGQTITLLDNTGFAYSVVLEHLEKRRITGTIEERKSAGGEPRLDLALYLALLRHERFEWVLQKGTELGVRRFVPIISERSTAAGIEAVNQAKLQRWERIVREAAEQSRRARLPELSAAQPFATACATVTQGSPALFLWEGAGGQGLRSVVHETRLAEECALFSGPEGGWSEAERATAVEAGLVLTSLGPRTLRAETAPLVAMTVLLYSAGDLE